MHISLRILSFYGLLYSSAVLTGAYRPVPRACGRNEEWRDNGCDPYCRPENEFQDPCPDNGPQAGCYCIQGYIRDIYSTCIRLEDCSRSICSPEKTFSTNSCSPYCADYGIVRTTCPSRQPRCACRSGYGEVVQCRQLTGKCVPKHYCRPPYLPMERRSAVCDKRRDLHLRKSKGVK